MALVTLSLTKKGRSFENWGLKVRRKWRLGSKRARRFFFPFRFISLHTYIYF